MATNIQIPATWLNRKRGLDINAFLLTEGLTVVSRERRRDVWIIRVRENLNSGQQNVLNRRIIDEFNTVKFTIV